MLVYVDDILITGSNLKLIQETKEALKMAFKMKELGELKYFLGIEFTRFKESILMHQTTVSRSSAEAEYRSLASTVSELIWLIGILKEVSDNVQLPVHVYSDSKAAIQIAVNPVYHERTKHIEINCHFIREKLQQGLIIVKYVPIQDQLADVLTKSLPRY